MFDEINKIKIYARDNHIPIMLDDGIDYLCEYIKKNRIKTILEIGTGIGYSAIRMAKLSKDIHITTIEKDENRFRLASVNVTNLGFKKQIKLILGNALDIKDIDGKFDLIFIDASKTQNINFFNRYRKQLNKNGTIITDNLSFHGLVEDRSLIKTKNQEHLVKQIKEYIAFLDNNEDFITTYVNVGDKLSITKRKEEK